MQAPYPLAMVVCDSIWKDPYTGKHTLIGTFSAIEGPEFPLVYPVFSVYVSLTDGDGKTSIRLELVDVDEECEPIFEMQADVEFPDQRAIAELRFQAVRIRFPAPGEFHLKLFAGDEFVIERRILALRRPEIRGGTMSHTIAARTIETEPIHWDVADDDAAVSIATSIADIEKFTTGYWSDKPLCRPNRTAPARQLTNEQLRRLAAANPPASDWFKGEEERPF